jgi:lysophospholipase L1-like esterase
MLWSSNWCFALAGTDYFAQGGTRVLDLNHELCPDGTFAWTVDGIQVRSDGVHLTPDGMRWLTPWLVRALAGGTVSRVPTQG